MNGPNSVLIGGLIFGGAKVTISRTADDIRLTLDCTVRLCGLEAFVS